MVGDSVCEWHTTSSPSLFSSDLSFPRLRVVKEGEKKRGGGGGGGRGKCHDSTWIRGKRGRKKREKKEEEEEEEEEERAFVYTQVIRTVGSAKRETWKYISRGAASFLYFFSRFFSFTIF